MNKATGKEIARAMRANKITIRQAAEIFGITLKRVRYVRARGVDSALLAWEWLVWLPEQAAKY